MEKQRYTTKYIIYTVREADGNQVGVTKNCFRWRKIHDRFRIGQAEIGPVLSPFEAGER